MEINMVKTIEELKKLSNDELVTYYEAAQGNTKDFQTTFGVEYSYTALTSEMRARGFVSGMYIPSDKKEPEKDVFRITIQRQSGNSNMNLTMTNECKERYKQFIQDNGDAFVHTTAALTLYMDLCEGNRLEVLSSHIAPKKGKRKTTN